MKRRDRQYFYWDAAGFEKGQQLEDLKLVYDLAKASLEQAKAGKSQDIIQKENINSAVAQVMIAKSQLNN